LTSKLIDAPEETVCPAGGYCLMMTRELARGPTLTLTPAAVHALPTLIPAFLITALDSPSVLPTKLGITYLWPLSGADNTRSIMGEGASLASGGGLCATTVSD